MKRALSGFLLVVLLTGCAKVHITPWRGPALASQPYKKILVCVSPRSTDQAREIERAVVKAFAPYPVAAAACLDALPAPAPPTADDIAKVLHGQSFDAVLVLERESIVHWSGPSGSSPVQQNLTGFLADYAAGPKPDANPLKINVVVSHQQGGAWRHVSGTFRLFDAATGQLVWKGDQAAKAPTTFSSEHFVEVVAEHNFVILAQDGLILSIPTHP